MGISRNSPSNSEVRVGAIPPIVALHEIRPVSRGESAGSTPL